MTRGTAALYWVLAVGNNNNDVMTMMLMIIMGFVFLLRKAHSLHFLHTMATQSLNKDSVTSPKTETDYDKATRKQCSLHVVLVLGWANFKRQACRDHAQH